MLISKLQRSSSPHALTISCKYFCAFSFSCMYCSYIWTFCNSWMSDLLHCVLLLMIACSWQFLFHLSPKMQIQYQVSLGFKKKVPSICEPLLIQMVSLWIGWRSLERGHHICSQIILYSKRWLYYLLRVYLK